MSMQSVVNLDLFGNVIQEKEKVVNVSSVPQRSPFRYPGGKTWLVPTSRKWFRHSSMCDTLIEPFCGGGITGLTAVSEGYFRKVVFSEIDEGVAAVWKTMLNENCGWLISKILIGEVKKVDGQKVQEVRIVYNFVGEIPEIAA